MGPNFDVFAWLHAAALFLLTALGLAVMWIGVDPPECDQ